MSMRTGIRHCNRDERAEFTFTNLPGAGIKKRRTRRKRHSKLEVQEFSKCSEEMSIDKKILEVQFKYKIHSYKFTAFVLNTSKYLEIRKKEVIL